MSSPINQSINQSVINNERKKERKKAKMGRIGLNFYLTDNDKDLDLLEKIETLRHRDRWTVTEFLKQACTEYISRHFPGNPGLPLTHWTENEPFSEAATEKLQDQREPKPSPDYSSMTNEHLLERYNSPFTDSFDIQLIALEIQKRGFNLEDLRRDKRLRQPQ